MADDLNNPQLVEEEEDIDVEGEAVIDPEGEVVIDPELFRLPDSDEEGDELDPDQAAQNQDPGGNQNPIPPLAPPPPPVMANLNNDQFARLLQAAQGGGARKRIEPFSTAIASDWNDWKSNFRIAVTINGWDHCRARREIGASMTGTAKQYTSTIPLEDEVADWVDPNDHDQGRHVFGGPIDANDPNRGNHGAVHYEGLLTAYDAAFLPGAGTQIARLLFAEAEQMEGESNPAWHHRVRVLYQRVEPGFNAAAIEASLELKTAFIYGLRDPVVRNMTFVKGANSYSGALLAANEMTAGKHVMDKRSSTGNGHTAAMQALMAEKPPPSTKPDAQIVGAVGGTGTRPQSTPAEKAEWKAAQQCYHCGNKGHFKRECRKLANERRQGGSGGKKPRPDSGKGRVGAVTEESTGESPPDSFTGTDSFYMSDDKKNSGNGQSRAGK